MHATKNSAFGIRYLSKTKHKTQISKKNKKKKAINNVFDQIGGPCKNSANPREIEKWPKMQHVIWLCS